MSARVLPAPRRRPPRVTVAKPNLLQTLRPTESKIVTLSWSLNGHYLAAALQHGPILLFAVLPTAARPLRPSPLRTFKGHTADVLQLTFSPTQFLASASMDRTIRLWHPHTAHCLRRLAHPDIVTAVAFKPSGENLLLSAGCDGIARLWRLADQTVVTSCEAGAVVSAASFLASGDVCLGTYDGRVVAASLEPTLSTTDDNGNNTNSHDGVAGNEYALAGPSPQPSTVPVRELVQMRRMRGRRKPGMSKVSALLCGVGPHAVARGATANAQDSTMILTRDGRLVTLGPSGIVRRRLRVASGRKEGTWLGGSVSTDGSFLLIDGLDGSVRLADLRVLAAASSGANGGGEGAGNGNGEGGRRREGEVVAGVQLVQVMEEAAVSSAAFVNNAVFERCNALRESGSSVVMAVGGDDGTLSIVRVEQVR